MDPAAVAKRVAENVKKEQPEEELILRRDGL